MLQRQRHRQAQMQRMQRSRWVYPCWSCSPPRPAAASMLLKVCASTSPPPLPLLLPLPPSLSPPPPLPLPPPIRLSMPTRTPGPSCETCCRNCPLPPPPPPLARGGCWLARRAAFIKTWAAWSALYRRRRMRQENVPIGRRRRRGMGIEKGAKDPGLGLGLSQSSWAENETMAVIAAAVTAMVTAAVSQERVKRAVPVPVIQAIRTRRR
mmetsp:Transcript_7249/g.15840  ORF Transcript_7249/g.15840 Transcript_7249/m.15840 type:complete len:209 (-) Transcript_7249:390-1016(-)